MYSIHLIFNYILLLYQGNQGEVGAMVRLQYYKLINEFHFVCLKTCLQHTAYNFYKFPNGEKHKHCNSFIPQDFLLKSNLN